MFINNLRGSKNKLPSEFEKMMTALPYLSYDILDQMHQELLQYSLKSPLTYSEESPEEYLAKNQKFEDTPIESGLIYGCSTYGEAIHMNRTIVNLLDEMED